MREISLMTLLILREILPHAASPVVSSIQPTTFAVNGNVSLTCITSFNFPPGNISWVGLNGVSLSPARFLVNGSGVLTIFQVLRQDAGEISCTVTNQYGQSSITANIQVLCKSVYETLVASMVLWNNHHVL